MHILMIKKNNTFWKEHYREPIHYQFRTQMQIQIVQNLHKKLIKQKKLYL